VADANISDELFIRRALELAREGIGLTSPNPCVGAVIVDGTGKIVGTGLYKYDALKHAEVLALEQAGEKARGATLYINLEPCSHRGRTGPCADALIAAGVRRVVASMTDPNPQVRGGGFAKLESAGIKVDAGILQQEAKIQNRASAGEGVRAHGGRLARPDWRLDHQRICQGPRSTASAPA
jgi:diaminohydroxyphosphoribosylaminopyrimidine deaminase/5-amino-6-(5-phosphoribosylamino)uracil reductase